MEGALIGLADQVQAAAEGEGRPFSPIGVDGRVPLPDLAHLFARGHHEQRALETLVSCKARLRHFIDTSPGGL